MERKRFEKYQKYLLLDYHEANNEYITNRTLENFHKMSKLYDELARPKPVVHKEEYFKYTTKLIYNIEDIKKSPFKIGKREKEANELSKLSQSKSLTELQKISELISIYRTYFSIIEVLKQTYTDISYIETLVSTDGYMLDLDLMVYNLKHHLKLERSIINNILYEEYENETSIILDNEYNWRIVSYLEDNHKTLKQKWYCEKQKIKGKKLQDQYIKQYIYDYYIEEINQILKYDNMYELFYSQSYQQYLHNKKCEENIRILMNILKQKQ